MADKEVDSDGPSSYLDADVIELDDEQLRQLYDDYRNDEDGMSEKDAYASACSIGRYPTTIDVASYWEKTLHKDHDYKLTLDEFIEFLKSLGSREKSELALKKALDVFDTNGDGVLDREELKRLVSMSENTLYGEPFDEEFFDQTFDLIDKDKSGVIEKNELYEMLIGTHPLVRVAEDEVNVTQDD